MVEKEDDYGVSQSTVSKGVVKVIVFFLVLGSLLGLMVWDLREVQIMSAIIHDDHTGLWSHINSTVLAKWLTQMDICLLNANDSAIDLRAYKSKNCSHSAGEENIRKLQLYCNIGSSFEKPCRPPLLQRTFFQTQLKNKVLGDPRNKILSNVLRNAAEEKRSLVFVGDGISKQNFDAVACELLRTDRVTITGKYSPNHTYYYIKWKTKPLRLNISYFRLKKVFDVDYRRRRVRIRVLREEEEQRRRLSSNSTSSFFGSLMSSYQGKHNQTISRNVTMNTFNYISEQVEDIRIHSKGLIVVANVGVWYNSRERFRREIPTLLKWLNNVGKNNNTSVFFRETSAQHWNYSDFGYYYQDHEERSSYNGSCVLIADSTPDHDWRNHDVRNSLVNEQLSKINIISFRDLTLPLYNMHPTISYGKTSDCTHFCYFPQMWQSIWFDIGRMTKKTDGSDNLLSAA